MAGISRTFIFIKYNRQSWQATDPGAAELKEESLYIWTYFYFMIE